MNVMRILIAHDGSDHSEAALDDLTRAGMPEQAEALIMSVAEVWLPPSDETVDAEEAELDPRVKAIIERQYQKNRDLVAEAQNLADHAKERLQKLFQQWTIGAEATWGSPAWEILDRARGFEPDLILVGSHGRSAVARFLLGSISQKVVTEAKCSVRVARKQERSHDEVRIVIGFDGSKGAQISVEKVCQRAWPENTEVRLVAIVEDASPSAIGRFIPPVSSAIDEINGSERAWIEELAEDPLQKLKAANINSSFHLHSGDPKSRLVEEAEKWNADSIFVGANAFGSRLERFILGSTSSAIAARATCSVEIVRIEASVP